MTDIYGWHVAADPRKIFKTAYIIARKDVTVGKN